MAALLSGGGGGSVPTSVIHQAPLPPTGSPGSSGGSPGSGGEDSYFSELALYGGNGGGSYSGPSGLDSPHRRKKLKKQRNLDGSLNPDACPSGKRKNREGKN